MRLAVDEIGNAQEDYVISRYNRYRKEHGENSASNKEHNGKKNI